MIEEYTTYEAVEDAVRCFCRADKPSAAAHAMMRAVRALQETRTEGEIIALAEDRTAWEAAVELHVRAGSIGRNDIDLSSEIVVLLLVAIEEESIGVQAPAPIPKGKHFTARLAERMARREEAT